MSNWFRKLPQSLVQSGKKHKGLKYPILLLLLLMAAVCRGIDAVGTLTRPTMRRRIMAAALTVCMVFTMIPIQTFAAETRQSGGLCEHHPVHTEDCGYSEGTDRSPCTHEHTEDCYKEVTKCVHEHTAECYPDDNSVSDNDATPSDATEKEPTECTHFCSEETGCVTEVQDCPHEHDDACGYVEAVADTPCGYTCDLCAAQDNGNSGQNVQPPVCDCDEPCVEGDMNTACPVCGAEGAVPSDCGALPTLLNASMPAGTPITGDGYSFDPDSCELTISSDDGTTAWRSDSQISTDNQYPNVLSVVLADTVTAIGDNAFSNCTNLTSIQLPDTLTSIGNRAFSYCSQDGEISLDLSGCTDLTSIGEYTFYCFDGLTNIQLPNTLTSIGNRAFSECRKLTSLDMSGCTDLTSIETNAFNNCTKLETINLPNSLSSLGEMAFYGCLALTSLDLSGCTGLTSIGRKTFYSCRGLESVKLPSTLESIGNEVFDSCALLAEVTFTGKNAPTLGLYVFSGTSASLKIIVPADGTGYTGTTASTNWKALADKIQQPSEDDANNDGYHDGDVAVINAMIDSNELSATKDDPADWSFAIWDSNSPKRITKLGVSSKSLTGELDVSGLTSLTYLDCRYNQLVALSVSGLTSLTVLYCNSNQLTALDVSGLTSLTELNCSSNQLTALDVSDLTSLTELYCNSNQLTALDVSGLTNLTALYCGNNPFASLKLSDTLSLTVPATEGGTVKCTGYTHSSKSVKLKATADTGYTFEKWTAEGVTLTNDTANPVTFTLDGNITVTPVYADESTDPDDTNGDGYHDGDVAAINAIIENNGLSATKDGPVTWDFATWSSTSPKRITELDLRNKSLTGTLDVSGLTSLTRLNFNKNQLTALNVSDLTNLGTLDCSSNQLTELDVSSLTSLTHLVCNNNQLTALDVSGLTSLIRLECIVNKLTTLNVSDLTSLTQLYCNSNPLTSLKLSDTLSLTVPATTGGTVECTSYTHSSKSVELQATADTDYTFEKWTVEGVTLTDDTANPVTFTLNGNIIITPVYDDGSSDPNDANKDGYHDGDVAVINAMIDSNGLSATKDDPATWDFATWDSSSPKRITVLNLYNKSLTGTLGVSGLTSLTELNCTFNELTALDVSGLAGLTYLYCYYNQLAELNVSGLTSLRGLSCNDNQLTALNVSGLTSLTYLDCYNNQLTALNVSGLTSLPELDCSNNRLTALDVSGLTDLTKLDCSKNQLAALNVSDLTSLTELYCYKNQLTALNVSGLTSLTELDCSNNHLTALDVSGLMSLTYLGCEENPLASLKLSDTLSLTVPATEGGTVMLTSYTHNSKSVKLQATADNGYTFEKWTASGTTLTDDTSNPVTFTLDWNITVTPVYSGGIPAPTVTSVEITPKTASVQKGMTQQFGAAVTGTDSPAQTVTWTVTGGKAGTSISTSGLLTVASDETAATLTVTATSTVDTTKSGTATVTVTSTPVTKYILTVTNGTGGGSYEAGAVVSITAGPAPQGQIFDKWISADGVSFGNAASATTTITMPAKAVTVAATYKDSPVAVSHTITASAGTGGSISPSGTVNVNDGANQTFTITANSNYSISSVTVDGVNQGGISTYTFSGVTANHTISATFSYNGGGSSGGGSGSGGSSSSGSQTDKPSQSMTGSTTTNVTVDGSGNANVTVTNQNVNDAIAAAKAEAQKQGVNVKDVSVVINVATDKAAAQITANLPKTVQDSLISNNVGSVEIKSDTVTMWFSQTAIQQMNSQAQADVTITAAKADNSKLTGEAKTLIGFRPMFNFTATYGDGKSITNFGTGSVYIAIPYTLGANEKAENVQVYYIDGGGVPHGQLSTYDTNRKAAVVVTSHYSTYAVGYKASAQAFGDIASHWAKSDIEYVTSRGLLNGTGKTTFSPDSTMTRGMFVTALGRLAGINPNDYKTSSFTDVKVNAYYAPYVEWAAQKNIVSGTGDKLFSPDLEITREQMAVIMVNYAGKMGYSIASPHKAVTFADNASISEWAAKDVSIMQQAGVLMGRDGNRFDPQGAATRAEASAVLHRFVELVIDPVSAQGWTKNDSGHWLCYKDGKALTGWQTVDGLRYFFNADGVMHEGWKQDTTADKWYYWTTGGAAIGWKEIDGKWYYFNADGTMAVNTKVDGYEIGADGARKE
ncbi:leucine-rich repeat domain-containing protein [Hungatella effluvii]|uniref:leucine-rich repeat domain-containing protein n=1 Tax=Hungatella effluvii TaxID=1096246 RepID=UPI0022E2BAE2|nr:leucine-rich repeat domain-containing protein [Hungatella effluvii]